MKKPSNSRIVAAVVAAAFVFTAAGAVTEVASRAGSTQSAVTVAESRLVGGIAAPANWGWG